MANYGIKVDLLKLQGAFTRNLKGKTTTKRCIIIPIDENPGMFLGEKGCYLNLSAFETQGNQYGDTHLVKTDLPKEVRERMTEEQRRAVPILGNMRPIAPQQGTVSGTMQAQDFVNEQGEADDLPF
ncbi:MAG: hypothetical protein IJ551_09625 [Prevotella sp.]|nr:hypothetical protein [Prevotella sp.]